MSRREAIRVAGGTAELLVESSTLRKLEIGIFAAFAYLGVITLIRARSDDVRIRRAVRWFEGLGLIGGVVALIFAVVWPVSWLTPIAMSFLSAFWFGMVVLYLAWGFWYQHKTGQTLRMGYGGWYAPRRTTRYRRKR